MDRPIKIILWITAILMVIFGVVLPLLAVLDAVVSFSSFK